VPKAIDATTPASPNARATSARARHERRFGTKALKFPRSEWAVAHDGRVAPAAGDVAATALHLEREHHMDVVAVPRFAVDA